MGQCCGKPAKYGAFRDGLGTPLLNELTSKLNQNARVLVVRLTKLSDIAAGNSYTGLSDVFVEVRVTPNDPVAGMQKQTSAVKPNTLNPSWAPPEIFRLVLSNPENARVLLSAYHFNLTDPSKSTPLGDGIVKFKEIPAELASGTCLPYPMTVKLKSPETGHAAGQAEITVQLLTIDEASSIEEHMLFEYQRWQPIIEWGSTEAPGHFLPTDPGRWCTANGKKFGKEIDDVAPPIPPGWEVSNAWHTVSTETDPDGWQYSVIFESPYWHAKNDSSTYVLRRRSWHREIRRSPDSYSTVNPITGRESTSSQSSRSNNNGSSSNRSNSNSGRRKRMFSKDPK